MLMLVVTIIIAAVVSMYASGLIDSAEKATALTMAVSIKKTGVYVTEPIATKDLKLVTSWSTTNKTVTGADDKGGPVLDGTITSGGWRNHYLFLPECSWLDGRWRP